MAALMFPPRLMKAKAAAHYLGMSPSKFYTLNLPCKRDGGNVLYDIADLDAYADTLPYEVKDTGEQQCQEADAAFGGRPN